jgi:hypothetical protein
MPKEAPDGFRQYIAAPFWQHYAALLKLGIVLNSHGEPLDKLQSYMEWQRDKFFFSVCTTIFAVQSLGPQPIADPLKQSKKWSRRHPFRHPLNGVRNAAWDMSIVKYWSDRIFDDNKKNVHWLFCSLDASLQELAKYIIVSTSLAPDIQLRQIVKAHWPMRMVDNVVTHLAIADYVRGDEHKRRLRIRETKRRLPNVVKALEDEFMNTRRKQ